MNLRTPAACISALFLALLFACSLSAQPTNFHYQGTLTDNGQLANGTYDFEFELFDALEGGSAVAPSIVLNGVEVTDGNFSVSLDFGDVYPGEDRFLEIRVQAGLALKGGGKSLTSHTTLLPRQKVAVAPYAVKSKSAQSSTTADQLGGIDSSQYVLTTDPRMSDSRPPTAGSTAYIQNSIGPQAASNFNISGTGKASVVDVGSHYSIGGTRILAVGLLNEATILGQDAGLSNTGPSNSFVGNSAGQLNTSGALNSFFGSGAGASNTTGSANVFLGFASGFLNSTGSNNSFFGVGAGNHNNGANNTFTGRDAGYENTVGFENSYYGMESGKNNVGGARNSFFGFQAGFENEGGQNSFFGALAGYGNVSGNQNSIFGNEAGVKNTSGQSNSFFGSGAGYENVTGSNNSYFGWAAGGNSTGSLNSFFGSESGVNNTGSHNAYFGYRAGIGPSGGSSGSENAYFGDSSGAATTTGFFNAFLGRESGAAITTGAANTFLGRRAGFGTTTGVENTFAGAVAGSANVDGSNNSAFGRGADFGSGSLTHATAIGSEAIVTSSNTVQLGRNGQDYVRVGKLFSPGVTPLCLSATNEIAACTNAIIGVGDEAKEARFEEQKKEIESLRSEVKALKALICEDRPEAAVCQ